MSDITTQHKIAQELRLLADYVEVSRYCKMSMNMETPTVAYYGSSGDFIVKDPTGEIIVNITLTYIKENDNAC